MFIDTHAHLDDPKLASEASLVLERAQAVNVGHILTVATTHASSVACQHLARLHPAMLSASAGIHPNHVAQAAPTDWDAVAALARAGGFRALGETGLDRHWNDTPFPQQEDYFRRHLALGRELDLTVIIHCREAEADMLRVLRDEFDQHGPIRAVMHSFVGDKTMAEACLAMGLHLSFAGMLTYKNAEDLRATAATLPIDRLMVETDSPYLAPVPQRGKRNEPAHVIYTAACLARLHGLSPNELGERTTQTARALFRLPE